MGLTGVGGLGVLYATVPRRILVDGRVVAGAQSLDVMTDAEWRGRGLYLRMAADAYGRLSAAGTSLVYGFPNGEAMPGFRSELGWEMLGPVPFLVRPLPRSARRRAGLHVDRPGDERLLPGIIECAELPDGIDGLWRRVARGLRVAVVRDAEFLQWRLYERPEADYQLFAAYLKGRLVAFGGVSVIDRHGARIGYVLELLVDPAEPRRRAGPCSGSWPATPAAAAPTCSDGMEHPPIDRPVPSSAGRASRRSPRRSARWSSTTAAASSTGATPTCSPASPLTRGTPPYLDSDTV